MRQIQAGFMPDARVASANPTQMLHAPAARNYSVAADVASSSTLEGLTQSATESANDVIASEIFSNVILWVSKSA
jgi:hypothetical protein